ncbi:MAG: NmrA family NAD(P)-binding protein [Magnetospirillum sp.]|nr:NmrA family NAD(P)-binding protein [Magnetospirillum sp.]
MYAITGITGKVGGELARALLAAGQPVRAVVRDADKGPEWAARGCQVTVAEMEDAEALARAFTGTTAAFILPPSEFDPAPGYSEAREVIDSITRALQTARPGRVLSLSTIGADAVHHNLLTQRTLLEAALRRLDLPVTLLRPAWFMENAAWDVAAARDSGVLHSFLQPADKAFPMVATRDIGRLAARLIQEEWTGLRVVELEGPRRVSPNDLAQAFATVLGRPVEVRTIPRESWETLFRDQGMRNPGPRVRMLDGFNEGWIEFAANSAGSVKGPTELAEVIAALVTAQAP